MNQTKNEIFLPSFVNNINNIGQFYSCISDIDLQHCIYMQKKFKSQNLSRKKSQLLNKNQYASIKQNSVERCFFNLLMQQCMDRNRCHISGNYKQLIRKNQQKNTLKISKRVNKRQLKKLQTHQEVNIYNISLDIQSKRKQRKNSMNLSIQNQYQLRKIISIKKSSPKSLLIQDQQRTSYFQMPLIIDKNGIKSLSIVNHQLFGITKEKSKQQFKSLVKVSREVSPAIYNVISNSTLIKNTQDENKFKEKILMKVQPLKLSKSLSFYLLKKNHKRVNNNAHKKRVQSLENINSNVPDEKNIAKLRQQNSHLNLTKPFCKYQKNQIKFKYNLSSLNTKETSKRLSLIR